MLFVGHARKPTARAASGRNTFGCGACVYAMFQLMFAIITPALIVGAIAERIKYTTLLIFIGCWMFLVYFPMAHMDWGITGFMNGIWNFITD